MSGSVGHRLLVRAAVVVVGVAVGLAGARLALGGPGARTAPPSVKEFSFATRPPEVATAGTSAASSPTEEPEDAAAAVAALLRSEQERRPDQAWPLLDAAGRARHPTAAAWARARSGRPAPVGFEIVAVVALPDGAADVKATVTNVPSLDPFAGIVTVRSEVTWRATNEDGRWRVASEPESTVLELPADDRAPATVREWLAALEACDAGRARQLQVVDPLYGPADLASAPCRQPGQWVVGATGALAASPDTATLQAAFGADVVSWGRVVPVRGPSGAGFLAALAPLGERWRVMGVTAAP